MKLPHEFYKLPLSFDIKQMQNEVLALDESDWIEHPDKFNGNASIPLISVNGEINNDFNGPMQETKILKNSPYLRAVIASFGEVIGRSRLMRLAPSCEVPIHSDTNYHWYKRVRIHIPIITDENVIFYCGDKDVNMPEGEAWIFDSWKYHRVQNNGTTLRVHLVIDVTGSSKFWNMVAQSFTPCAMISGAEFSNKHLPVELASSTNIMTEQYNTPLVMMPGEMDGIIEDIIAEAEQVTNNCATTFKKLLKITDQLKYDWRSLWSAFGTSKEGWSHYQQLRLFTLQQVKTFHDDFVATNGAPIQQVITYCLLMPALNVSLVTKT